MKLEGKSSQAMMLGTNLAVAMAVFVLLGYYVDRKRGGGAFWTLCGMGLGLVYGAYEIWKTVRFLKEEEKDSESSRGKDTNGK